MEKYLPSGYELHFDGRPGKYIITKFIGKGSSSAAYYADYSSSDDNHSKHIIKEFNPAYISFTRSSDGEMIFDEAEQQRTQKAKERFRTACSNQIKIRNHLSMMNQTPGIEGPYYANNTIYTDVTAYNGETYDIAYREMSLTDRLKVCLSALRLVRSYHEAGYLCLDIKPENIFVIPETKELLFFIDFDSVCLKEDIVFGNSLSYTKKWAAPEQLNPYSGDAVSEASDIYAIGELVFWSVFERHSLTEEHRSFSSYPFEKIRRSAANLLTEFFHNTLSSSPVNRYRSADEAEAMIARIINELSLKEYIIEGVIRPKEYFTGRNSELRELGERLKKEKTVFLRGIGGIGKSELAKQYAVRNSGNYDDIIYMFYSTDLEKMICNDDFVSVAGVSRAEKESDSSYCRRKLRALKECIHTNSLMIIDNLNTRIEDAAHQDIWEFIQSLPCEIIVTTRSEQMEHQMNISEISDFDRLRDIFAYNCPYSEDQSGSADEIIHRVNGHTLLIELLAKQTSAAGRTPEETLKLLTENGIFGTGNDTVGLIKDGHRSRDTVYSHMKNIFSMFSMQEQHKLIIVTASLMPESGIDLKGFSDYLHLEDLNDLNYLIDNGWIFRSSDSSHVITVHPAIAEIVCEMLRSDTELQNYYYSTVYSCIETWSCYLSYIEISDSIIAVTERLRIKCFHAAKFIIRYVFEIRHYLPDKAQSAKLAMDILTEQDNAEQYSPLYEYALFLYQSYMKYYAVSIHDYSKIIHDIKKHYKESEKNKNKFIMSKFELLLYQLYFLKSFRYLYGHHLYFKKIRGLFCMVQSIKYYNFSERRSALHFYAMSSEAIDRKFRKNNEQLDFIKSPRHYLRFVIYNSLAEFTEKNILMEFISVPLIIRLVIKPVIALRKIIERRDKYPDDFYSEKNNIHLLVDMACMDYMNGKKDEALDELLKAVKKVNESDELLFFKPLLYDIYYIVSKIYEDRKDYSRALEIMNRRMAIGKELRYLADIDSPVCIGSYLNLCGNTEESLHVNNSLLKTLEAMEPEVRKYYLGDVLVNLADLNKLNGNTERALELYEQAVNEYKNCALCPPKCQKGFFHAHAEISEISFKNGDFKKSKKSFQKIKRVSKQLKLLNLTELPEFVKKYENHFRSSDISDNK